MKKLLKKVFASIKKFFAKITAPIRNTKVWKWLRKHILKSPFRGYFVSSWKEVQQVTWPDRKTSVKLTSVVLAFTLIFVVFTTALDYGFEKLAKEIFLK
jgi:preprotein translocase SecE subunit